MALCFFDAQKGLLQIRDDIVDMFRADGKADRILEYIRISQFFFCQLTVGGGGRMDDKTFDIGHVGQQRENFQTVDKPESFCSPAFYPEGEDRCASIWEIFFVQSVIRMVRERRMIDFFHLRVGIQVLHDFFRILNMAFQTEAQCFCSLKQQKSGKRTDAGAFVPQQDRTDIGGKSGFAAASVNVTP